MSEKRRGFRTALAVAVPLLIVVGVLVYAYATGRIEGPRNYFRVKEHYQNAERLLGAAENTHAASIHDGLLEKHHADKLREAAEHLEIVDSLTSDPGRKSRALYLLGLAYLRLREFAKAEGALRRVRELLPPDGAEISPGHLDRLLLESRFRVEGIMPGSGIAIVNNNSVRKGDWIAGVRVEEVTDDYVVFAAGDLLFSDSVDKYSPLAKRRRELCKAHMVAAGREGNPGLRRDSLELARAAAVEALTKSRMDMDQIRETRALADECTAEIHKIDAAFAEAKGRGEVIVGMSAGDVAGILGPPPGTQQMIGMEESEVWKYPDWEIYFKSGPEHKVVSRIQ